MLLKVGVGAYGIAKLAMTMNDLRYLTSQGLHALTDCRRGLRLF